MKIGTITEFIYSDDDVGDFIEDLGIVIDYWENLDMEEMFVTVLCGAIQYQVPERHCFNVSQLN